MDFSTFKAFVDQIPQLNGAQKRIITREFLKKPANLPSTKTTTCPICPLCSSKPMHKHGSFGGKVRYICNICGTTVNEGSHLITHRSRNPDKWPQFLKILIEGYSVREIAKQLDISPKTSFLWRKKVLALHPGLETTIDRKPTRRKRSNRSPG